jgi:hypothetical protein
MGSREHGNKHSGSIKGMNVLTNSIYLFLLLPLGAEDSCETLRFTSVS